MLLDSATSAALPQASCVTKSYAITSARAGRILNADELSQYKQRGFLSIRALAPASEIAELRTIIDRLYARTGREYGSLQNLVRVVPELRDSSVYRSCLTMAKQLLGRTAMYACDNALYKEPHGKHGTPWHQDTAFYGKGCPNHTLAFWIPFQDVTPENGCLHFIPLQRCQPVLPHRPYYPNDFQSLMTDHVDERQAIVCPLRAGDATVFGPLTPHSAQTNRTSGIRRAWALTFRPLGRWGFLTPSLLLYRARLLSHSLGF